MNISSLDTFDTSSTSRPQGFLIGSGWAYRVTNSKGIYCFQHLLDANTHPLPPSLHWSFTLGEDKPGSQRSWIHVRYPSSVHDELAAGIHFFGTYFLKRYLPFETLLPWSRSSSDCRRARCSRSYSFFIAAHTNTNTKRATYTRTNTHISLSLGFFSSLASCVRDFYASTGKILTRNIET
jgi:hypothetical protein